MMQQLRLLLLLCAAVIVTQTTKAATFTDGNLTYETTDGVTATVTGYVIAPTGSIEIPATATDGVEIYNVTAIGANAFDHCYTLTSIDLSKNIETIGASAFEYCTYLNSVKTSLSLTAIDVNAFYHCYQLTSIDLPISLETIGASAFGHSGLTSISIPSSVREMRTNAIEGCQYLTEVYFNWTTEDAILTPDLIGAFDHLNHSDILYVPDGCVDLYNKKGWNKAGFSAIKVFDGPIDLVVYADPKEVFDSQLNYNTITVQEGGEVDADGKDVNVKTLIIERTFSYTEDSNKKQWFNLALPFEGVASGALVQKWDGEKYVAAVCGVDYVTFNYNSERRAKKSATGANWDVLYTEGGGMGELIQFPTTGTHKYRFISPSAAEAQKAIKSGRVGSTYYDSSNEGAASDNGWNIVPAGKTYATADYELFKKSTTVQVYNSATGGFATQLTTIAIAPYEVFAIQLTAPYVAASTGASVMGSDAEVESYTLELVNAEGEMLDRIYLFDGSNSAKYRVGKMSALRSGTTQMAIRANGSRYCTYSTLASEMDKSYSVALTNCDDCSLVLKGAGSQAVSVDGAAIALDTPIAVENGEIVIKIGSATTDVEDVNDSLIITGENGYIAISGAAAGTQYVIANMSGATTYGITADAATQVAVPAGVYAVKVANKVAKVIVK